MSQSSQATRRVKNVLQCFNENLDKILQANDYSLLKQPDQIKIYPNEFQPLKWFSFMLIDQKSRDFW